MEHFVAINPFVRRQTPESPFSHFTGTFEELRDEVEHQLQNMTDQNVRPGYREGVVLVKLDSHRFRAAIVEINESTELVASYESRREGEEPRMTIRAKAPKQRALHAEVVLYHHDVLAEDGDASSDLEWEIISINAAPVEYNEEIPMQPNTLIANHFHLDGGTRTNLTAEEFEAALKKSVLFWKDKALVCGES